MNESAAAPAIAPTDVLDFWFAVGEDRWYAADEALDAEIRDRFGEAHAAARAGAFDHWAESPQGALALIILLDQFARNVHRGTAEAYAADAKALGLAKEAVARGFDMELPANAREWFYLPFMHSENLADQERCVELAPRSGRKETLEYAVVHRDVIVRFGRFPHRNEVLGRASSEAERAFLADGGFAG